jgi:hypothetical protein
MTEQWPTSKAAAECGMSPAAFRRERTRSGAPAPVGREPGRSGEDLYDADEVRAWKASRPGRWPRTDLKEKQ